MSDIIKELDKAAKNAKKEAEKILINTMVVNALKIKKGFIKGQYGDQISNIKDEIKTQLSTITSQLESLSEGKWSKSAKKSLEKSKKKFD